MLIVRSVLYAAGDVSVESDIDDVWLHAAALINGKHLSDSESSLHHQTAASADERQYCMRCYNTLLLTYYNTNLWF